MTSEATIAVDNGVPAKLPLAEFTFEWTFEVLVAVNGGYLITQRAPNAPQAFSRAFSDLGGVIDFLQTEKEKLELKMEDEDDNI